MAGNRATNLNRVLADASQSADLGDFLATMDLETLKRTWVAVIVDHLLDCQDDLSYPSAGRLARALTVVGLRLDGTTLPELQMRRYRRALLDDRPWRVVDQVSRQGPSEPL